MAGQFCPVALKTVMSVQDVFEAVGAHAAGNMSDEDLHELECVLPECRVLWRSIYANTMACVSEAIGLHCRVQPGRQPYERVMNMRIILAEWLWNW